MKRYACVDGLFEVEFVSFRQPETVAHSVTVICRAGRLFGADPRGGIYTGVLQTSARPVKQANSKYPDALHRKASEASPRSCLKAAYEIPPGAKPGPGVTSSLVPGAVAETSAVTVPISGEIDPWALRQNTTVLFGGKPVDIEITYLGPLPHTHNG